MKNEIKVGLIIKGGTMRLPTNPNAKNPFVSEEVIDRIKKNQKKRESERDSKICGKAIKFSVDEASE